ncbi:Zinc finger protein C725.08 [Taphrina deformans PYCC 5710]|uniref:Zinc finger protein C725.08 n=1 Tax=Taphrina deformans (strain PYCC 5710 / ATCC 11124 / CBS 356.35 / IMI 108563 / JCM 9778 / NBRC 8474) TaxID=1097556 RepID=R4XBK8_TAPDE|nr:Zinc finger protein C725.08 [Taphrina deformans PYCC 5710]|eukprot:CCG83168.1 Zinc finger protein C725.08 [Taphrina deformans PYCC 5710]
MQNRYDDYTTDLLARTAKPYATQQIEQAWFQDMYDGVDHTLALKIECLLKFKLDYNAGHYKDFSIELPGSATDYAMDARVPDPLILDGEISPQVLYINNLPPTLSRRAIEEHVQSTTKSVEHVSLSRPTLPDMYRICWLVLRGDANSTEIRAQLDGTVLNAEKAGAFSLKVAHYRKPALSSKPKVLWAQLKEDTLTTEHYAHVTSLLELFEPKFDGDGLWSQIQALDVDPRRRLDLSVEYLRAVHAFDYWDLKQYDSSLDLESHAPRYTRSQDDIPSDDKAFEDWQTIFQKKLRIILKPTEYLQALRVKSEQDLVAEIISSKVKAEDELRFRCQVRDCTKLFMDIPFVKKHIEKRHGDWVSQVTAEAQLFIRYLLDPHKVLPYREHHEPRARRQSSPGRRRRSPQGQRNGYNGPRGGRGDYRGPAMQNYRDLDRPAEELPELDY